MAARKTKVTSAQGKVQTLQQVDQRIEPPIKLTAGEREIFNGIIEGLPRDTWQTYRIRLAANLARHLNRAETLSFQLEREGEIIINAKGTPITNPLANSMLNAFSQVQTLTRTLGLSASQRGISETSTKAGKAAEAEAKRVKAKTEGKQSLL